MSKEIKNDFFENFLVHFINEDNDFHSILELKLEKFSSVDILALGLGNFKNSFLLEI